MSTAGYHVNHRTQGSVVMYINSADAHIIVKYYYIIYEWSVYFPSDKETAILNLGNPDDDDFVKEGHGWKA